MYEELVKLHIKIIVIATKYDKLKPSLRVKQERVIKSKFLENQVIYFTSSQTKKGIKEIISEVLSNE